MENLNIVGILSTGVTGFAFLMLCLGFKLTSDVQKRIFEQKADAFQDIEMYREWKGLVTSQLKNTCYFQLFSLFFFAGGLSMLIYQYQAESKIVLAVSPVEKIYAPLVCHQSKTIELNEGGRVDLTVKNGNNINIIK